MKQARASSFPSSEEGLPFKRALMAMDLSGMDLHLLRYFDFIAAPFGIQKVYFVHIMQNFSAPGNLDVEFQKLFAPEYPVDEKVRDKLSLDVQEIMGDREGLEISVEVREGPPYEKLMHWAEVKETDLLIVGKKEVSAGSGITAKRVARQSDCHILFVPENAPMPVRHLLVPIDLSGNSLRALRTGLLIADRTGASVSCLYVVDMPPIDYYAGTFQNAGFRSVLMDSAREAYQRFIRENQLEGLEISPAFIENNYNNTAQHIAEFIAAGDFDLILMGAKGHTGLEHFLYGSVTEKVVEKVKDKPVLVLR